MLFPVIGEKNAVAAVFGDRNDEMGALLFPDSCRVRKSNVEQKLET